MSANLKTSRTPKRRKAIALLWVALTAILFIGFVGLSLDTGLVVFTAEELQGAADASALAAAQFVVTDIPAARTAAVDIASLNRAGGDPVQLQPNTENAANGDIVVGRFNRTTFEFAPNTTIPNSVKVVARRTSSSLAGQLPLVFGPVFGKNSTNVERDAIAMLAGGTGSGLIALCSPMPCAQRTDCASCLPTDCECALYIHGNLTVSVLPAPPLDCTQQGAGISVNSPDMSSAFCAQGNAKINTPNVDIYGAYDQTGNSVDISDPCHPSETQPEPCDEGSILQCNTQQIVCDPLRNVPVPPIPANEQVGINMTGGTETIGPGYYPTGIRMTGGTLIMQPGIYVLGGSTTDTQATGFDIQGGAEVCGQGVMLYINGPSGILNISGNGCITLSPIDLDNTETPPTPCASCGTLNFPYPQPLSDLSPYEGLTIFQAPGNCNAATIIGFAAMNMVGSVYFPCNHLNLGGEGSGFGNQLIARTMEIFGDGIIEIHYDGRNPAFGTDTFLVE